MYTQLLLGKNSVFFLSFFSLFLFVCLFVCLFLFCFVLFCFFVCLFVFFFQGLLSMVKKMLRAPLEGFVNGPFKNKR